MWSFLSGYNQGWGANPNPLEPWTPEEWLVEVSGLPFGLMGDMLGGGQYVEPHQGALFGMTTRMPEAALYEKGGNIQPSDPRPLWRFWDEFSIAESAMCGWWQDDCGVTSSTPNAKVTVFLKPNALLLAVCKFGLADINATLTLDWERLGKPRPAQAVLRATKISNFQPAAQFSVDEEGVVTVPLGSPPGWMLTLVL